MAAKGPQLGIRHVQAALLFLNLAVNYIVRLNVGVLVVAMTEEKVTSNQSFPVPYLNRIFIWVNLYGYLYDHYAITAIRVDRGREIIHPFQLQLGIFADADSGQLPGPKSGGQDVHDRANLRRSPAKRLHAFGYPDRRAFCLIRLCQGVCQGLMVPCRHEHLAKWSPPAELEQMGVIAYSGIYCGTVLALLGSGYIANSSIGWTGISYVSAASCLCWCMLFFFWGENDPSSSYWIGDVERNHIESSLNSGHTCPKGDIPVPWQAIISSVPFRALVVVNCAHHWDDSTMEVQIPSYLHGVLHMSITKNGLTSSLHYLVRWIMSHVYILIAHMAIVGELIRPTPLKKWIVTVSTWGPALLYIAIGFLDRTNAGWVVTLMAIKAGLSAGSSIGGTMNIIALAPNHSALLMSILCVLSDVLTPLNPLITGAIVTDPANRSQWQIVFCLIALVLFLSNWVYIIWGSSELQPWDADDFLHKCSVECSEKEDVKDLPDLSNNAKVMHRDLCQRVTDRIDKVISKQQKNIRPKLNTDGNNVNIKIKD
ncbi:blast:Putative inorganic phosphate cotransporter [Drosophila guanche]|uniref:Blast:Putative inorganic phosphate cotransporter n=1 Tax=Drosophila guanche TaxID=7266 RepID=A0A3B0JXL6_DROGU|nr:blast:Putative inorganic phosphate cotransporter [Drosophila guanche]